MGGPDSVDTRKAIECIADLVLGSAAQHHPPATAAGFVIASC